MTVADKSAPDDKFTPRGYRPKVGDRVRVVLEGEVAETATNGWNRTGIDAGGILSHSWGGKNVVSVERLPDPIPSWVTDGTVLLRNGFALQRDNGAWYWATGNATPSTYDDDHWVEKVDL